MKHYLSLLFVLFAFGCATKKDNLPDFKFSDEEVSKYQTAYSEQDFQVFPFILEADTGPEGYLTMAQPNSANATLLRRYGVVFTVLVDADGKVVKKKVISGLKNMRGNNASFFNQISHKMTFEPAKKGDEAFREFVLPIALRYPLETY